MQILKIPSNRVVKQTARMMLTGRWTAAVSAAVLGISGFMLMCVLQSLLAMPNTKIAHLTAQTFGFVFYVLVLSPLFLGVLRFFWRMINSADDRLISVFYYFSALPRYIRAIKLTLVMGWRIFTAVIICMLPYFAIGLVTGGGLYQFFGWEIPLWVPNLILIESFLKIIGIVTAAVYAARYYLVPVIAIMDEERLLLEAVHVSCLVSKRSGMAFLSLACSCVFAILLSLLVIPAIYTLPFIVTAYLIHCRFVMVNYNLVLGDSK